MELKPTNKVAEALAIAQRTAQARGHAEITPDHITSALVQLDTPQADVLLQAAGTGAGHVLGQADAGTFLDCRSLQAQIVELGFAPAGLDLLVIDTKVSHAHSTGGYGERRAACERGAEIMGVAALRDLTPADLPRAQDLMDDVTFRRVKHVVTEDQRVLDAVATLRSAGPRAIGGLLDASHASMRDDFEISVPELDLAVDTARAAGAIGARMTGGGFGGSAIALVDHDLVPAVTDAVTAAFAEAGFTAPHIFTVHPSEGARRDA